MVLGLKEFINVYVVRQDLKNLRKADGRAVENAEAGVKRKDLEIINEKQLTIRVVAV